MYQLVFCSSEDLDPALEGVQGSSCASRETILVCFGMVPSYGRGTGDGGAGKEREHHPWPVVTEALELTAQQQPGAGCLQDHVSNSNVSSLWFQLHLHVQLLVVHGTRQGNTAERHHPSVHPRLSSARAES